MTTCPACSRPVSQGQTYHIQCEPDERIERLGGMKVWSMMVWCVVCIEPDKSNVIHIFSSPEKANEFCERDPRVHVTYDYVIDCPERMEQPTS